MKQHHIHVEDSSPALQNARKVLIKKGAAGSWSPGLRPIGKALKMGSWGESERRGKGCRSPSRSGGSKRKPEDYGVDTIKITDEEAALDTMKITDGKSAFSLGKGGNAKEKISRVS